MNRDWKWGREDRRSSPLRQPQSSPGLKKPSPIEALDPPVPSDVRTPEEIRAWAERHNLLPKVGDELPGMKVLAVTQDAEHPENFTVTVQLEQPINFCRIKLV